MDEFFSLNKHLILNAYWFWFMHVVSDKTQLCMKTNVNIRNTFG